MRQPSLSLRAVLAAALCVTSLAASAQSGGDSAVPPAVVHKQKAEIAQGDPARWTTGDNSLQERLKILKKEIGAAYAQAKTECGKQPKAERSACLKDAQATYRHDMAAAPELARNAPSAEVTEKRVIDSTVPPPEPAR